MGQEVIKARSPYCWCHELYLCFGGRGHIGWGWLWGASSRWWARRWAGDEAETNRSRW
jgi:hypothetical protein